MTNADISEELRAFLLEYVHTYEQLETLFLLYEHAGQDWTADAVSEQLKIPDALAADTLLELSANLVLERVGTSPSSYRLSRSDVRSMVQSLSHLYKEHRLGVMQLMNANAIERVRTGALRAFSDAFIIGGRKKDG